jgi:hypothetical protein
MIVNCPDCYGRPIGLCPNCGTIGCPNDVCAFAECLEHGHCCAITKHFSPTNDKEHAI